MRRHLVGAALAVLAGATAGQDPVMKEHAGVRFACGGVGAEERAALAALRSQANVELLFVTAKRGGYLADAAVSLYSSDAAAPRLQFNADGPMCVMLLPAGRYRIEAVLNGVKQVRQASASTTAGKPARLVFQFPPETWDGVWASEEEKQQQKAP
jgi:hypothetical protein